MISTVGCLLVLVARRHTIIEIDPMRTPKANSAIAKPRGLGEHAPWGTNDIAKVRRACDAKAPDLNALHGNRDPIVILTIHSMCGA